VRFVVQVKTWSVNELADVVAVTQEACVDEMVAEYLDRYEVSPELLPALAVQRLMADGYGFGAQVDWKTAMLVHAASRVQVCRYQPHGGLHQRHHARRRASEGTVLTFMGDNRDMSKKIDSALKDLVKALKKHAEAVSGHRVTLKKTQRASARVRATATAYAAAVHAKTGQPSPFSEVIEPGLEATTLASLAAERDAIAKHLTGEIPMQKAAPETAAL
jgi:ribosome-associated translation inhibitor RaiA